MKYNISRYEKNLNHEGEVVSIFLAVSCSDGTDSSYFEHWLDEQEVKDVLKDEANLKPILEKCYAECELKIENEVATRPMPTIFPLQEKEVEGEPTKKETLEAMVKVADIAVAKEAVVEAKLQAIEDMKPKVAPLEKPIKLP